MVIALKTALFFCAVCEIIFDNILMVVLDIRGVTGGTDQTSGECSLGHTIPI